MACALSIEGLTSPQATTWHRAADRRAWRDLVSVPAYCGMCLARVRLGGKPWNRK